SGHRAPARQSVGRRPNRAARAVSSEVEERARAQVGTRAGEVAEIADPRLTDRRSGRLEIEVERRGEQVAALRDDADVDRAQSGLANGDGQERPGAEAAER